MNFFMDLSHNKFGFYIHIFSYITQTGFESILKQETRNNYMLQETDYTQNLILIIHVNINSFPDIMLFFIIAPVINSNFLFR